ncbi:hypothetical protein K7640_15150 [Micromonospora sp. PLK6-60]|uniref:hypothetical protein n=1 Tax=Micromonospora sp. PLK6-60 TaxID=2873383 RepID=UPI001CA65D94|nr:hypothetical protein [Micromonospora sp. PLK6-60]MBY8873171.1 hypothetical protein [Micromonospora sp. PLK6-60]
MRMTVGPLPPAVYWRRRAVVLGAGLLFLIVLLYSCQGSDPGGTPEGRGTPTPGATGTAAPDPTGSVLTPQSGGPGGSGNSGDSGSNGGTGSNGGSGTNGGTGSNGGSGTDGGSGTNDGSTGGSGTNDGSTGGSGTGNVAPVADEGTCTDAEISVRATAQPAEATQGNRVDLTLVIKNSSSRTCNRDVGADAQELFVKAGAAKVWSSDTCGTGRGSEVRSLVPNAERSYTITWNGRDTSRCASGLAAGPYAPAGTYEVFARVGTKLSEPVQLVVHGAGS